MRPLGLSGHFFLSYSSGQFSLGGVPPSPYVSVVTTSSRANICCTIDDIQVIDSWRSMWLAGAGKWGGGGYCFSLTARAVAPPDKPIRSQLSLRQVVWFVITASCGDCKIVASNYRWRLQSCYFRFWINGTECDAGPYPLRPVSIGSLIEGRWRGSSTGAAVVAEYVGG